MHYPEINVIMHTHVNISTNVITIHTEVVSMHPITSKHIHKILQYVNTHC